MEVAESREQASVGHPTAAESTISNGDRNHFLDDPLMDDDGRSSSLSEPDDLSDNEPSDFEDPIRSDRPMDNDSEAETERIEDSPHNVRKRDIVLSAGSAGPSPSKLHQSTTLDDVDDDTLVADDSPSKPRRTSKHNGLSDDIPKLGDSELSDSIGKKRKRVEIGNGTPIAMGDSDEPIKKRRSSIKSDLSDPIDDDTPLSPEPLNDTMAINDDNTPADDAPELDLPSAPPLKGQRNKKGKRKERIAQAANWKTAISVQAAIEDVADKFLGEDEQPKERDEPDDTETVGRAEEECKYPSPGSLSTISLTPFSCEKDVCHGFLSNFGEGVCNFA